MIKPSPMHTSIAIEVICMEAVGVATLKIGGRSNNHKVAASGAVLHDTCAFDLQDTVRGTDHIGRARKRSREGHTSARVRA